MWLILQVQAIGVMAAAAATAVSWWRNRKHADGRATLSAVLAGSVVFLPWAVYWGLLMP